MCIEWKGTMRKTMRQVMGSGVMLGLLECPKDSSERRNVSRRVNKRKGTVDV